MENQKTTLDDVFAPRGIAIVGASNNRMAFAELIVMSLKHAGYPNIYPVNPKYDEVMGLKCYPSITAIEGPVDHVVVNIRADLAIQLLNECAVKGVRSVHFFTAGFGESGIKENAHLEQEMLQIARAAGFRIIGPNCIGLFVPKSRLVNDFTIPLDPGPVAFISQSGGHAYNLPVFGASRGLRFSKVVSYGNALDVNEIELLDYFADDDETEFIAAYIEGVQNGEAFKAALDKAAARKPVIIYKGGRSEAGLRAAHGHTASMTSSIDVFDAVCKQKNVIRVDSIEEMIDVLVAFKFCTSIPQGYRVALVGAGGGPSVLAADEMEAEGLKMPSFPEGLQDKLKAVLPVAGSILSNPLDTPNMATPEGIAAGFGVLGNAEDIDMIVYHLGFHPNSRLGTGFFFDKSRVQDMAEAMVAGIASSNKTLMLAIRSPHDLDSMREFLEIQEIFIERGIPVFNTMGDMARAMRRVIDWQKNRSA